jgi:hypothetical protein
MLFSHFPFAVWRQLLLDLGFAERVVEGQYLGLYDAASHTIYPFRLHHPQDQVSLADLPAVREQLAWRGLLSEEAFDALRSKASA